MDIRGKKILVIGGAGLIGSHVAEELLKEDVEEVIIYDNFCRGTLDNLAEAMKDPRCRIFEIGGDIMQTDILDAAMKGVDGVIHLAALWLLQCHEYPRAAFDVNIRGTFNVLEACVANEVERLVYSSSASVYGDAVEEPMGEDHPYNNWTFYGATKIAGEHMMKAYHKRYGLKGVGLRYMNVYGPRQDYKGTYIAVMMKILDNIDRGISPVVFGDGSQAYDFIYVRDTARANVCGLKADIPFGFYNVGRGIKTSIKELTELILKITGSDLPIQYEPAGQTFVTNRVGSPTAAETDLDFRWTVDLEDGLRRLTQWRKSHISEVENRRAKALA
ncbi:MAG: SDR family NAD(P)-dependent oxidoreductase [Deltaproteobacteria bacterium]|nr:SDR family NAD(P)-dependent oxidoreductase [Deltaproteobacteria bacterium]MBW2112908.1 SDR family NAD(P)-dependent oxidoreductase [Deltaproteobacteria bacterium]MBW2354285.1 SDR family NAD(P)-dependent oxidoreductase [Deltaproteobacteria bacterium]HDZ91245.1 SDR family NAD(P)-dependent oxidoreductase [Deltaproteobacteria bacterium]